MTFPRYAAAPDPVLTPAPDPNVPAVAPGGSVDPTTAAAGTQPAPDLLGVLGQSGLIVLAVVLTAIALTTLWWMLHAWRSTSSLQATRFSETPLPPRARFTLMVPARYEEAVMGRTLDGLVAQTHPDVEILAIVGDDDPGTAAVAEAAAARHPDRIRVVVDSSVPKNKPKALNTALRVATGDIVGVFDAEDDVHPELLRHIDSRFQETGAGVVQGGVQLMNFRSSWWALRNVLEYYFWFRSRLHFHAGARFIPLGGNTVFIRRELLERMNGWDAECLAEDCEIGVRLSSAGVKVVVAYSPEFVTREETPGSLTSLYKQRTRWNQGFLQVLRKREWTALPTFRQRMFARYLLSMPFLQAFTGLLIPLSIVMILLVKVPTWVALITFVPLAPTLVTLAAEIAGLGEFGRIYGEKVRMRDYLKLVLGTFPFQVFLALAAIRAVVRQLRGQTGWEKTEHSGVHRVAESQPVPVPVPASSERELEGALR